MHFLYKFIIKSASDIRIFHHKERFNSANSVKRIGQKNIIREYSNGSTIFQEIRTIH